MGLIIDGEPFVHGLDNEAAQRATLDAPGQMPELAAHWQNTDVGTSAEFFRLAIGVAPAGAGAARRGLYFNNGGVGPNTAFAWEARNAAGVVTGRWVQCLNAQAQDPKNSANVWEAFDFLPIPENTAGVHPRIETAREGIIFLLGRNATATPPVIGGFNPISGAVGAVVLINGNNFGAQTGSVKLGALACIVSGWSNNQISVKVPSGGTSDKFTVTTAGGSDISRDTFTVAVVAVPTVPGIVTGLTPTPGDGQVVLTWSAPANTGSSAITDYEVRVQPAGGAFSVFAHSPRTATNQTVTGLINGQAYNFTVAPKNAVGPGAASAPVSATPAAVVVTPPAPTITSFTPTTGAAGSTVVITGTNFTGATLVSVNNAAVAMYIINSATQITASLNNVQVTGRIRVTTPGGTAVSATDFTVTSTNPASVLVTPEYVHNNAFTHRFGGGGTFHKYGALSSVYAQPADANTSISVWVRCELPGYSALVRLPVLVNGSVFQVLAPVVSSARQKLTITGLPAGAKTIEFRTGGSSQIGAPGAPDDFLGTYIEEIEFETSGVLLPVTPGCDRAIWHESDSRSIGQGATEPAINSYVPLTRESLGPGTRILVGGWGAKSTLSALSTDAKIAAYLDDVCAWFDAQDADEEIYDLGFLTNDYNYNPTPPSLVKDTYRKVVFGLITRRPGIRIILSGMDFRTDHNEANPTTGAVPLDYDSAVAQLTLEPALSANTSFYSENATLNSADLDDGLHFNNAGHIKKAARKASIYNGTIAPTVVTPQAPGPDFDASSPINLQDLTQGSTATLGEFTGGDNVLLFGNLGRGVLSIAAGASGYVKGRFPLASTDVMMGVHAGPLPARWGIADGWKDLDNVFYRSAAGVLNAYELGNGFAVGVPNSVPADEYIVFVDAVAGDIVYYMNRGEVRRVNFTPGAPITLVVAANGAGQKASGLEIWSDAPLVATV